MGAVHQMIEQEVQIPMRQGEGVSLQFLYYLIHCLSTEEPDGKNLIKRLDASGLREEYETALGNLETVVMKLYGTLPPESFDRLDRKTRQERLVIRARNVCRLSDGLAVVERKDLCAVMRALQQNVCVLCDGGSELMRTCECRSAVKHLTLVDHDDDEEQKGICIGQTMKWVD